MFKTVFLALTLLSSSLSVAADQKTVQHDMELVLDLQQGSVTVRDQITLPLAPQGILNFSLDSGARIKDSDIPVSSGSTTASGRFRDYSLRWPQGRHTWRITVELPWPGEDMDYLWLDSAGSWYPQLHGPVAPQYPLLRHTLKVVLPAAWQAVSQGAQKKVPTSVPGQIEWQFISEDPQQTIEFVAAPFKVYSNNDTVAAKAYLLQADEELAGNYLRATSRYISLYEKMLGAYPYRSFSLVENPEQTGYGMPSFTLLGSRIIRLPFIINTSYPHEILHNWWGNSVYVDTEGGNWSEGLTAYLADHYLKGTSAERRLYRRDALQAYRNYVSAEKEFALKEFRSRHDRASQAVGYNKTLMFFHMLRLQLGDEKFFASLRELYRQKKFQLVSFHGLRPFFEQDGVSLRQFFSQWIERVGAPILQLDSVTRAPDKENTLRITLRQVQNGPAYELLVPALLKGAGATVVTTTRLHMRKHQQSFDVVSPRDAKTLHVDPHFDVFRLLDLSEVPPSIGEVFGQDNWTFVLPRTATSDEKQALQAFTQQLGPSSRIVWDDQASPQVTPVLLLGRNNRLLSRLTESLSSQPIKVTEQKVEIAGRDLDLESHTVVIAGRVGSSPWLWVSGASGEDGLARRLRHYGKYSYLAFARGRPVLRGQWNVQNSSFRQELH